jgi:drug/metabolite transporter (DMT)-like permease
VDYSYSVTTTQPAATRSAQPPAHAPASADAGMLLVCLIWGTNYSVVKYALAMMPPLAFTAARFAISSVVLAAILRWREGKIYVPRELWMPMVLLGILGNTAYQIAFTLGLAHTTATNSSLIISTMPTIVVLFGAIFGIERPTPKMVLGVLLGTGGVILVIAAKGIAISRSHLVGDLISVAALFCWAGYTLGVRRYLRGVSPLSVTTITCLTGTPGLILAGLPELAALQWNAIPAGAWGALLYASILSLVVAYFIWNTNVQRVGTSRTSIYMCVTPLVAACAAWVLLGERPVPLQGVGAALIFAGVLLARR